MTRERAISSFVSPGICLLPFYLKIR